MLVLTRRIGEAIMIGDQVEVTVLSTDGMKVRLGIAAPTSVPVHRREIYLEIKAREGPLAGGEEPIAGGEQPIAGGERPIARPRRRRAR
jgi:carbon storage regulator